MSTTPAILPNQIAVAMTATPFWGAVRRARARLGVKLRKNWDPNFPIHQSEPWIYITAVEIDDMDIERIELKSTMTFEVSLENACQAFARRTHRLATDEEIESHKSARVAREERCRTEEERVNPSVAAQRASKDSSNAMTRLAEALVLQHNSGNQPAVVETHVPAPAVDPTSQSNQETERKRR